jgi:hypothetical protein
MTDTAEAVRNAMIALAVVVFLIAAGAVAYALATAQPGGSVWILVGVSPSENASPKAIGRCVSAGIVKAVDDGALVKIAPISRVPAEMSAVPVATGLSLWQRFKPRKARETQDDHREALRGQYRALAGRPDPPPGSSDTVAAAAFAADEMNEAAHGERRTLLICGDAHQVGSGLNVYDDSFTAAGVREHLRPEVVGDLSGVDVVFGAAYSDAKAPLPAPQEAEVKRFWTAAWASAARTGTPRYAASPRFAY